MTAGIIRSSGSSLPESSYRCQLSLRLQDLPQDAPEVVAFLIEISTTWLQDPVFSESHLHASEVRSSRTGNTPDGAETTSTCAVLASHGSTASELSGLEFAGNSEWRIEAGSSHRMSSDAISCWLAESHPAQTDQAERAKRFGVGLRSEGGSDATPAASSGNGSEKKGRKDRIFGGRSPPRGVAQPDRDTVARLASS